MTVYFGDLGDSNDGNYPLTGKFDIELEENFFLKHYIKVEWFSLYRERRGKFISG